MRVSRYTPSLLAPEDLEALFVQRHTLAGQLVGVIRDSALTDSKHYTLLIGPRGIGKTHLVSMLYHRVAGQEDLRSHLVIAWLREEEWGLGSFFDLVLRILNALQAEYKDDELADEIDSLYELAPEKTEAVALSILKTFMGDRTLLLFVENLDEVFAGLGDIGQKRLRSFLQEQGCCTMVATSQSLFNGVKLQTSPFYGFFRIRHLKDFSVEEAVSLLTKIAQQEEDAKLVDFLRTPKGRSRVQAVHHLAGGNPRIYVVFSEFLTHKSLDELIQPFMNMLDDLTPYYQARMMYLSPQQRKIIEVLSRRKYAMPVKEIAQRCFVSHQTVSSQLKDLRDKGYVLADSIGRQSFYELREPLMRICLSVKETRGEPVRLIVDFLKAWYPRSELQGIQQKSAESIDSETQNSIPISSERSWLLEASTSDLSVRSRLQTYVKLALEETTEETDPRISGCIEEILEKIGKRETDILLLVRKLIEIRGDAVDYFGEGNALSTMERYEEAISSYDKALEIQPNFGEVWYYRGDALYELERYAEAVSSYDKNLEIQPEHYKAWLNRGVALRHLDRYDDALASFDAALKIKSDSHEAWLNQGAVLDDLGCYEKAIVSYDKALEINPDLHEAWFNRGCDLVDLGFLEEAIFSYEKALEIQPSKKGAWLNRGTTLASLGLFEEAIVSYGKTLEIKPDDDAAWYNRGNALSNLGRYEEAIVSYNKALEIKLDKDTAWYNRGNALSNLGRYEEAIVSYDKALEIKPDKGEVWNNRGAMLTILGLYQEAIFSYDKALEIKPTYYESWNNIGVILANLGCHKEAISNYDKTLEIKPDYVQAWCNRGAAWISLSEYDEAVRSLDKALEIKPDLYQAWNGRGIALIHQGCYEEAISSWDKALESKPDDDISWYNRGYALVELGFYEEAIASYDKALEFNPEKHFGLLNRAEIVFASNPNDVAYQTLENALGQLTDAEKMGNWQADIMLRSLFQQNQDTQQWQLHIQKLIPLFKEYQFLNALGVGLTGSCNALISEMVSQNAAQAWLEVWTEATERYKEFKIPLRLLKTAVHYKAAPEDPRVFLQLPTEERTILKQALGLETG